MPDALDRAGASLVAVAVGWTFATGAVNAGSRPAPVALALVVAAAATVAGRLVASYLGVPVVAGAVVAVAGVVQVTERDVVGYANATGAVLVQGALAGVLLASVTTGAFRTIGVVAAVVLALATVTSSSFVAVLTLASSAALVALARSSVRAAAIAAAVTIAVVLGVALAAWVPSPLADVDGYAVRAGLWGAARDLLVEEPLTGVGPGRFEDVQAFTTDRDLRWGHSAPLQQAAEQGLVGLALLVALAGWALLRCASGVGVVAGIGIAAVTAAACHGTVDHVLRYPLVVAAVGLLVGAVSSRQRAATTSA